MPCLFLSLISIPSSFVLSEYKILTYVGSLPINTPMQATTKTPARTHRIPVLPKSPNRVRLKIWRLAALRSNGLHILRLVAKVNVANTKVWFVRERYTRDPPLEPRKRECKEIGRPRDIRLRKVNRKAKRGIYQSVHEYNTRSG